MARVTSINSLLIALMLAGLGAARNPSCKYIPGDAGWPGVEDWASLNQTVEGRLIKTVQVAAVCHTEALLNTTECQYLKQNWDFAYVYEGSSSDMMNPYFQNQSCDPFTPQSQPCVPGNYAVYAINVTGPADVTAGIKFAKKKNIRLTIRNTGHDYMGKSTGKGALSLWTGNMKSSKIIQNYTSSSYNGPAMKFGAGVIGGEAYELAHSHGYRVVGGSCASVGISGGYSAGGGHSLLNSIYGMAADQVLEWEVVTVGGEHLIATPKQNSDLYWALSGGGGGTYAVVLSMTSKVYQDGRIGGGKLNFNATVVGNDTFWDAVTTWFTYLPAWVDAGNSVDFEIASTFVAVNSITIPGGDATAVSDMLAPYLSYLTSIGIAYELATSTSATYYDHYNEDFGPLPYGGYPTTTLFSNRLIPRAAVEDPAKNKVVMASFRQSLASGTFFMGCHALNVNQTRDHPDNAVLPAWREAITICIYLSTWEWNGPWEDMLRKKAELVDVILPSIDAATPGSGTYLNEVDSNYKGNWTQEFYGANYPRLLDIKTKYDPDHFLYAYTAVGSKSWTTDESGRICRVEDSDFVY